MIKSLYSRKKASISYDQKDLLEGPLLIKIIRFVIPLLCTNLLQMCYSAADMIVVGLSPVKGAIGAIGTTTAMINLILNTFTGFALGTTVVVARNIGKNDKKATENSVHTALMLGSIAGFICLGIGIFVSRPTLAFLGDEGRILDLATLYTTIYFLGAPFLSLTNFFIAIFRAKGDTKTPLFVLTVTGVLNVGLNLLFVLVFNMSVDGVAVATVISNIASTVILCLRLSTDESWIQFRFNKLQINRDSAREILRDGLPAALQGAFFSISNMIIQSSIIGLNNIYCPGGSGIIDGNAAGTSLEGFAYTATNSVCQASVTFTSQHYGAKKYERIGLVMRCCYLVTACIAIIATLILVPFRIPLIKLYVSEQIAIDTGALRLLILLAPYFLLAFMEVGSGIVRGLSKPVASTAVTLTGCCTFRIIWIFFVYPHFQTLECIYISYPISWGITALCHFIFAVVTRNKLIRNTDPNGNETVS